MKTSPRSDFIDYWDRGSLWCFGVRVWLTECKAISNDPGESPDKMVAIEPPCKIPLNPQALPNRLLIASIAAHMGIHPDSDLLNLLTGKITFAQALVSVKPNY
jgi:hypothetical protein